MNEVAEAGSRLWTMIALAVYWAYLVVWREHYRQNGRNMLFGSGLPPPAGAERTFDRDTFLSGARNAYEFILKHYAAGETSHLAGLVAPCVLEAFSQEAERRKADGKKITLTFVALEDPEILDLQLDDVATVVRVRFRAELFVTERGSTSSDPVPEKTQHLQTIDLWTFRREHQASNRQWILVATEAP